MFRVRRWAHFALALVLAVFAVAPHGHDGLTEGSGRETLTALGACQSSGAQHLHAAQQEHAPPCVACVRHHSAGALHPLGTAAQPLAEIATFAAFTGVEAVPSIVFTPLRAPPASRS